MNANRFKRINEYIDCACGKCGLKLLKYNKWGVERKYIHGHQCGLLFKGRKHSPETLELFSKQRKGRLVDEKHPAWKGDDVGYHALHKWVKKHFPKSQHPKCMLCKVNPSTDLSNITGIYNRELKNWAWFCHSCNLIYDNAVVRGWITKHQQVFL